MTAKHTPVRIKNAADLFSVLETGNPMEKFAVLQSIIEYPERPISLGPHQGEDFVDLLVRLIPKSSGSLRQAQVVCLMSYQDERAMKYLIEEFAQSRDPETVLRLVNRIRMEKEIAFFRPFLWSEKSAQALAAARLCQQLNDLSTAEKLRVAILSDTEYQPPALSEQNLDLWMTELTGRHRVKVRQLAAQQQHEALILWDRWSELEADDQEWLMEQTERLNSELLKKKLPGLVASNDVTVSIVNHCLKNELTLPDSLLSHADELIRAAAISAGLADDKLDSYFGIDVSTIEASAAASRARPEKLIELLDDKRWQVRAAASAAFCDMEDPPLEKLRLKTQSEDLGTKVAAVKVLELLGDVDWLEANIA